MFVAASTDGDHEVDADRRRRRCPCTRRVHVDLQTPPDVEHPENVDLALAVEILNGPGLAEQIFGEASFDTPAGIVRTCVLALLDGASCRSQVDDIDRREEPTATRVTVIGATDETSGRGRPEGPIDRVGLRTGRCAFIAGLSDSLGDQRELALALPQRRDVGRGGMSKSVSARRVWAGAAALLIAFGCSSSDLASDNEPTSTAVGSMDTSAGSTTPSQPRVDCSPPPAGPDDFLPSEALDETKASAGEARLGPELGFPRAAAALADDLVVLTSVDEIDLVPTSEFSSDSIYTRSDLALVRLRLDGTVVWNLRLGTFVDWYLIQSGAQLAVEDNTIRVLWPRFDGSLPDGLDEGAPATLVLSTVTADGAIEAEVSVDELDPPMSPHPLGVPWLIAVGANGTVAVGKRDGGNLTIRMYDSSGSLRWDDHIDVDRSDSLAMTLADDVVTASGGGSVIRWTESGERRWELDLAPSSLAPVTSEPADRTPDTPSLVLQFHDEQGTWFCALDDDGVTVAASDRPVGPGEVARSWWTNHGLLIYTEMVATGSNERLISIDPSGSIAADVLVGFSGDVIPSAGSSVADVALADGALLLVGGRSVFVDEAVSWDLESWRFIHRLPPPSGDGDLSNLPIVDFDD